MGNTRQKLYQIVKRGPKYVLKKGIMFGDKYFRKIVRDRYIRRFIQGTARYRIEGTVGNATVFSQSALSPSQFTALYKGKAGGNIQKMADAFCRDELLLFGSWVPLNLIKGHYPWNQDFIHGKDYSDGLYTDITITENNGEIKIPWELGRMHPLPVLALAWRIFKEEKYLAKIRWILKDFRECVRFGYGVQWKCTMEVAIRIYNVIIAYSVLKEELPQADELHGVVAEMVWRHGIHIFSNLETSAHLHSNNHYLADLLGLLAAGASLDSNKIGEKWYIYAKKELEKEIQKQILEDGICFEMSSAYTRLDAEIFFYSNLIVENRKDHFSARYHKQLNRMAAFLHNISDQKDSSLQLGDNDSGRILILKDRAVMELQYMAELIDYVENGIVTGSQAADERALLFGCLESGEVRENRVVNPCFMKTAGIAAVRSGGMELFLCNTDSLKYDVPGHSHNDKLSINLFYKGKPFIVDPGSGCYTSNTKMRDYFRSNKQHSTFTLNDQEQNKMTGVFRVEYCATKAEIQREDSCFCARHNAYADRFGAVCERKLSVQADGVLLLEDSIQENGDRVREFHTTWALILHPDVRAEMLDQHSWLLDNGEHRICMKTSVAYYLEKGFYSDAYLSVKPTSVLRTSPQKIRNASIEFCAE